MIETWKTRLNMGHQVGNLSKAFDSLNHEYNGLEYNGLD